MFNRLLTPALALTMAVAALPAAAHEHHWHGLKAFPCNGAAGDWHFDGLYGYTTEQAVRNFQKANGLVADGVAGPRTLRALGLKAGRTQRCGLGGNDVLALQEALAAKGFWHGTAAKPAAHAHKPAHKPAAHPTPAATPTPAPSATPSPEATPRPQATPTPYVEPTPAPEASAMPVSEAAPWRPTLELRGGAFLLNDRAFMALTNGATNWDFGTLKPNWTGDASLWAGSWGIGGAVTSFSGVNAANVAVLPGGLMYDGLVKWRGPLGRMQWFGGYRGLNVGTGLNFGTLGAAIEGPLVGEWLVGDARLQGGYAANNSYFVDWLLGLGLHAGPATLEGGFRHMTLQPNAAAPVYINGPQVTLKLAF